MSDSFKTSHMPSIDHSSTWPERIYLYGEDMTVSYENQPGSPGWSPDNYSNHKNIEYIRADLVKEQISKLRGAPFFKANNFVDQDVITPEEMQSLYKNAEHRELK